MIGLKNQTGREYFLFLQYNNFYYRISIKSLCTYPPFSSILNLFYSFKKLNLSLFIRVNRNSLREMGPFTKGIMEDTKMDDLSEFRVGYPYLFTHQVRIN